MTLSMRAGRSLSAFVVFAALAATEPALAQHIDPQTPSSVHQRGSVGQPFPGIVEDLEVLSPGRFALKISYPDDWADADRVQIYSGENGPVGRAFTPDQGKVYDVAPSNGGGVWVAYYSANERTAAGVPAAGLKLQFLSPEGEPVGPARLLTGSVFTDAEVAGQPRRVWLLALQSDAVAVAFTRFEPSTKRHQLVLTTFGPDGREGPTQVLGDGLEQLPSADAITLGDGGALLAWGTGSTIGERLYVTRIEPDGQWSGFVRELWEPSAEERLFDVRLAPITGGDDIAAVFTRNGAQVMRRVDATGTAKAGLEVLNTRHVLIEPVRVEDGRLLGLGNGTEAAPGLYAIGAADPESVTIHGLNARVTRFAEESADSIVVALVVPPSAGSTSDGPTFSYLYRIIH